MAITGSFSVYYKYTDDIKVLLGSYTKPSSGDESHGGIYKQKPGVYTMYNDGYYVYNGAVSFDNSQYSAEFVFDNNFIDVSYNVEFDLNDVKAYGVSASNKYVDRFTVVRKDGQGGVSPVNDVRITIEFKVFGYWK